MNENISDAIDWLNEITTNPNGWRMFYSDSETKICAEATLALLKEREAKNGYWINPTSQDCHCSECGEQPIHEPGGSVPLYDFCPYCGAKMEEKWNDESRSN